MGTENTKMTMIGPGLYRASHFVSPEWVLVVLRK